MLLLCRDIPANVDLAIYINRKGFNSLNVLVTGGCDKLVYNAPGSYHDAGVYQMYAVKPYLESRFLRNISLGFSFPDLRCVNNPLFNHRVKPGSKQGVI